MPPKRILPVLIVLTSVLLSFTQRATHSQPKPGVADIGPIGALGGAISGSVSAPIEFKAAQVYAKNVEKRVTYMVYTVGGHYRFMHLFPGTYEVSVRKNGFACEEVRKITVAAGRSETAHQ